MPPRKSSQSASPRASSVKKTVTKEASASPRKSSTKPSATRTTASPAKKQSVAPAVEPIQQRRTASQTAKRSQRIENEARASVLVTSSGGSAPFKFTPENDKWDGTWEFGGAPGAVFIFFLSHFLIYYAFTCINSWGGELVYTGHSALNGKPFLSAFWDELKEKAVPSYRGFATYLTFLFLEWFLAVIMPGPVVLGRPVPSEGGYRHPYKCNAVSAWYVMLALILGLWYTGTWNIAQVAESYGEYLTSAIIIGNIATVVIFAWGFVAKRTVRMSGNLVYDYFMGSCLNPKLPLGVDFKMVAELRVSWAYLFFITLAHALHMYGSTGRITNGMWLLMLGHFLYSNACQKGEECVPSSWDIYYEKFGWMLIFWNLAGVPVFYGVQALFIVKVRPTADLPDYLFYALVVILCLAYYVFDTSIGQKNRFRMTRDGVPDEIIRRKTLPYFSSGHLENPKSIKGPGGKEILIDGWVGKARKINYTADSVQAFIWGASCGFGHFLPFLYWTFHFFMLIHRNLRDEHLMATKYGPMWDEYVKAVPYRFIPGLI